MILQFCGLLLLEIMLVYSENITLIYEVEDTLKSRKTYTGLVVTSFNEENSIFLREESIQYLKSELFDIKHKTRLIELDEFTSLKEIEPYFLYDQNTFGMVLKIILSGIKIIRKHTFSKLFLEKIEFKQNWELEVVENEAFYLLYNLKTLTIQMSLLKVFNSNAFKFLLKLKVLNLSQNYIATLPNDAFGWILNNSTEVYLDANKISSIEEDAFQNLKDINFSIILNSNNLTEISESALAFHSFFKIDIAINKITELAEEFFEANFSVKVFDISCDSLANITKEKLYNWAHVNYVDLSWHDCKQNMEENKGVHFIKNIITIQFMIILTIVL